MEPYEVEMNDQRNEVDKVLERYRADPLAHVNQLVVAKLQGDLKHPHDNIVRDYALEDL